jgi:hypothetical protein
VRILILACDLRCKRAFQNKLQSPVRLICLPQCF